MVFLLVAASCASVYDSTNIWSFANNNSFNFASSVDLTSTPQTGLPQDNSTVGYWSLNEGTGNITHDSSGNKNNGALFGPTWVASKYQSGLDFDGVSDYLTIPSSTSLALKTEFSLSFWFTPSQIKSQTLIGKSASYPNYEYYVTMLSDGRLSVGVHTSTDGGDVVTNSSVKLATGSTYNIVLTWAYPGQTKLYINGTLQAYGTAHNDTISSLGSLVVGDLRIGRGLYTAGIFDDIRVYNRTLSASDVATLYILPDPSVLTTYYRYQDCATNNTLLIYVSNPQSKGNNSLVSCRDFFNDSKLHFQANDTATVNLWTNLGHPVYTSGVWNSQNYTTTLTLDASSTGELDWNPNPPYASNLSLSSNIVGKNAVFSALWSDDHSLSGGGYVFSTNNTGQWVNASWAAFSSTLCWGNSTLALNSQAGVVVGFQEYANNSLNFWGDSSLYTVATTNESSALSPTPSPSSTPTTNPSPTPTSVPISSPTASLGPSQTPTPKPSPISTQNNLLSTQSLVIVGSAVALLVVLFAMAFKKGYVTIELIDEKEEEGEQWESQDYSI